MTEHEHFDPTAEENMDDKHKHLLELIEFSLVREMPNGEKLTGIYGINVAKVREVVKLPKINKLAASAEGIEGLFELRKVPIPAINLCQILGDQEHGIQPDFQIIVTEFSGRRAGFIVHSTHRIRRIPWTKVLPPSADAQSCISGMVLLEDNQFLLILDLEKIVEDIENPGGMADIAAAMANSPEGSGKLGKALIVEDSAVIRNRLSCVLTEWGFDVSVANDGLEGLEYLKTLRKPEELRVIITDLEMPRMDGYTLIEHIQDHTTLADIPVIIHSSLNEGVVEKSSHKINYYAYVEKNDSAKLRSTIQEIVDF